MRYKVEADYGGWQSLVPVNGDFNAASPDEVVTARDYDDVVTALRRLVDATKDTLRAHPETACCTVTKQRIEEAERLI